MIHVQSKLKTGGLGDAFKQPQCEQKLYEFETLGVILVCFMMITIFFYKN